ncbi:MAG: glycosyltransferase family 2 protein [Ornithinimicrobium sp.]|uniref:glycosyltransferase family 2 protein n=1 Tax=Ornithinimicrobium sp. TaxID=1977084 RepID=UPI001858E31F|nr:glycosyltransferase family 2 protein [Actinomycetota bacterium]
MPLSPMQMVRHLPSLVVLVLGLFVGLVAGVSVVAVLIAVATAAALQVLTARWGVWPWLCAVAAIPAVLSPVILRGGPAPFRELLLVLLVAGALLVLAWRASRALAPAGATLLVAVAALSAAWSRFGGDGLGPVVSGFLVLGALLAAAAALGVGRARGSGIRMLCGVTLLVPLVAGVAGALRGGGGTSGEALALALWPVAGAMGATALLRGRRGRATDRPQVDEHDAAASARFRDRYGDLVLAPVTVVIAAYNEGTALRAVLDELPATVAGLDVDVLVIDDGSSDETAQTVQAHPRPRLVAPGVNRGQGAALRLGYRIAREHGAEYIITTDADGQYDPADFEGVLTPVLDGTADFVTGSRRLGGQETRDRVRRLGVHVFAWTVSGLTGQWSTDTSFGLRAMRAAITQDITLNQPQYQSSELLIGVLSHGFRVQEVPGRMRVRTTGASKKGGNAVYGSRYARVVLGTWWREGCPSPMDERALALASRPRPGLSRHSRA